MKRIHIIFALVLALSLLAGCAANQTENTATVSGAEIAFSDGKITASSADGVEIDGTALTITASGTYVLSGSCADGSVTVEKGVGGVTLVLNGLTLTSETTAPIVCGKGSEVTIEAAAGTENTLTDTESNNDETGNAADNEPLDADGAVTVSGGTVLEAGGSGGMGMSLAAAQPCVIFGGTMEMPGENLQNGQPGAGGQPNRKEPPSGEERSDGEERPAQGGFVGASLLTQDSSFTVANSDGAVLYTGEAAYNASFVFFSSPDLSDGESYTLTSGETQAESAAQTGVVSIGMGSMGGPGGQRPDGTPPSGGMGGQKPDGSTPPEKPEGENTPNNDSDAKA